MGGQGGAKKKVKAALITATPDAPAKPLRPKRAAPGPAADEAALHRRLAHGEVAGGGGALVTLEEQLDLVRVSFRVRVRVRVRDGVRDRIGFGFS